MNSLIKLNLSYDCKKCNRNFSFKNALHKHLRICLTKPSIEKRISNIVFSNSVFFIEFCLNINIKTWHFLTMKVSIDIKTTINEFCIDTDCDTFMTDRFFVSSMISEYASKIKNTTSLKVKDIEDAIVSSTETIVLNFSFFEIINEKVTIAKLSRKMRIVNNLSTKILIEMNIINFENMTINVNTLIIDSCKNIKVDLTATRDDSVNRTVICVSATTVSSHISMKIKVKLRGKQDLSNRDYMFHSEQLSLLDSKEDVFSHIMNSSFFKVMITNSFDRAIILFRRFRLSVIKKFEEKECYIVSKYDAHLAAENWNNRSKLKVQTALQTTQCDTFEIVISNEITIYETKTSQNAIKQVVEIYFALWSNDNDSIVKISENDWMSITLLSDAKISSVKIYSIESKDKQLIDDMFDKLHEQSRMKYSKHSTSHDYSVFVTWRTILRSGQESVRKNRVVVNIRELNKITQTDSYSMSLQTNITSAVTKCDFISVFDAAVFFYQWNVRVENRHKLIVVFHREQKQFNVVVMSFKESSTYVQRQIDVILRNHKNYSKAFINDIVVYSKTLNDHIKHLKSIFELLQSLNIFLSSIKSFLKYSSVQLLEQKVNAFELTTTTEKIEAIVKLNFFKTLKNLEIYFDFIEWLRHYVLYFAQKFNALQIRKTNLLKLTSSNKESFRKTYASRTDIHNVIFLKLEFYQQIQKSFSRQKFLFHFTFNKTLYIDMNASKSYEFDVMIYHTAVFYDDLTNINRIHVQFILFLSKMLTSAKQRYWFIEFEFAALV